MKARTVWLVRESAMVQKPMVSIERTASGALVLGVKVSGRTLAKARETAQGEFTRLLAYAKRVK